MQAFTYFEFGFMSRCLICFFLTDDTALLQFRYIIRKRHYIVHQTANSCIINLNLRLKGLITSVVMMVIHSSLKLRSNGHHCVQIE